MVGRIRTGRRRPGWAARKPQCVLDRFAFRQDRLVRWAPAGGRVADRYDLIVLGLGVGEVEVASQCARSGMSVLAVEQRLGPRIAYWTNREAIEAEAVPRVADRARRGRGGAGTGVVAAAVRGRGHGLTGGAQVVRIKYR